MPVRSTIAEIARVRLPAFRLPSSPKTVSAANAIKPFSFFVETRPPPDIDEIAGRICSEFRAGRTPNRRDLNKAPWCLWEGKRPIVRSPDAFEPFLTYVNRGASRRLFRRLASTYLMLFPQSKLGFNDVADTLRRLAQRFDGPLSKAAEELKIFDPLNGPERTAKAALDAGRSPFREIEACGIENLPADAKFTEAAFLKGLEIIRNEPAPDPASQLKLIKAWGLGPDRNVLFGQHRGKFVDALVLPFAEPMPAKSTRDSFIAFLVSEFGDPRLHPGRWAPMPKSALVLRRWLTDQSLRQFLDVFDDSALEYQWKYRRALWEAVYKNNLIADAWVIFDKVGAQRAKRLFEGEAPFARWEPRGKKAIQSGQGCLLLRIGRGVVAEWSHNGRCHIWFDADDPTAPVMHKETYKSDEVMLGKGHRGKAGFHHEIIQHQNSKGYLWQSKIANALAKMTGIHIHQREYVAR